MHCFRFSYFSNGCYCCYFQRKSTFITFICFLIIFIFQLFLTFSTNFYLFFFFNYTKNFIDLTQQTLTKLRKSHKENGKKQFNSSIVCEWVTIYIKPVSGNVPTESPIGGKGNARTCVFVIPCANTECLSIAFLLVIFILLKQVIRNMYCLVNI